ncbi:hypothetical protein L1D11_05735 [Vibrio sp. Isolate32]|uniref:hypothetical protein n=1 Tax=Vibrio sp. Isolate32 TaxID=2908538 RepID=UPI001EFDFA65|nr:hypothetical protein [Vibrio sp. Isolate32]MCG9552894.1 hypothetical protein [Vibrio sp. Isolate32]
MNIQQVFEELEKASDFELFRIKSAIEKVLEDPDRAKALKAKMTVGMEVEYFCTERNHYMLCSILKVGRTRVEIREKETGKGWSLPFYFLNLDHIDTELISNKAVGLSKAELSIGQTVGFISSRDNQEYIGQVSKLNPKRAVVLVANTAWTVPYSMLFPVLDSEAGLVKQTLILGGNVVK